MAMGCVPPLVMILDYIREQGSNRRIWKMFRRTRSTLIAYAYQILREREDARDQVQEAFKRMILQKETIEQPKAWLYRTVRNLCISHLRQTSENAEGRGRETARFLRRKI